MRESVKKRLDEIQADQEEFYLDLHRHPELSMQETRTLALVRERLEALGYETAVLGGGVVGVLRNGEGPTVLFRADMDGLPVEEATGLDYASTDTAIDAASGREVPVMHACGHDFHVAAALGAADVMATLKDQWAGTYIALFQPGEETAAGAKSMIEAGLADAIPRPDVAFGQHVLTNPCAGHVGTHVGAVLSTAASVSITVHGKGSHGSMPHLGIDPVVTACSIVMRLQTLVSREIDPFRMGVVTVGSVQAGAKANIIPEEATLLVNVRAYDEGVRDHLVEGIQRIARAECAASGCSREPDFAIYDEYPLTDNDAETTEGLRRAFIDYFGADRVHELGAVPASEDFSVVPRALGIPYSYWGFGGFPEGREAFPNHNPKFGPVLQPTLRTGTEAAVVAVLSRLGR